MEGTGKLSLPLTRVSLYCLVLSYLSLSTGAEGQNGGNLQAITTPYTCIPVLLLLSYLFLSSGAEGPYGGNL